VYYKTNENAQRCAAKSFRLKPNGIGAFAGAKVRATCSNVSTNVITTHVFHCLHSFVVLVVNEDVSPRSSIQTHFNLDGVLTLSILQEKTEPTCFLSLGGSLLGVIMVVTTHCLVVIEIVQTGEVPTFYRIGMRRKRAVYRMKKNVQPLNKEIRPTKC